MDRRQFLKNSTVGAASMGITACTTTSLNVVDLNKDILSFDERKKWLKPFACNIEQWFRPMPFLDRINAAKALGFNAVEIWNPNQEKLGKTPELIARRAKEQGIQITSYSPNPPNLADPQNDQKILDWLEVAIEAGKILNVSNFNLTGHKIVEGLSESQMIENYTATLMKIEPRLAQENMVATVEPYNPFNHKGHFIYGNEPLLSICRTINSPNIKINWDFFHMQRTNGNLITNLENGFDQVAYIQFADSPNRNQPGTGEVAYGEVFKRLRALGYKGYIGAEFFPKDQNYLKASSDLAKLSKSINLQPPSI